MALHVVKLPDVGEGVAEAEVVEWHVQVGDEVLEDQILAAVMTDKATVEIPSPFKGRVCEVGPAIGAKLAVGGKLVVIERDGIASRGEDARTEIARSEAIPAPADRDVVALLPPQASAPTSERITTPEVTSTLGVPAPAQGSKSEAQEAASRRPFAEKPLASPAVRARARSLGVDLRLIRGSGPANRISHQDLENFLGAETAYLDRTGGARRQGFEEIKLTGLRRKIAERMADSCRRIAHFSYVEEVDLTALEQLRSRLNGRHADAKGKLTLLPFLVRALALAARDFPQMNAHYDDMRDIVVRHFAVHVGIATQTDGGLMVPVLAHAEALDIWQSAREIGRLAAAAREHTATRQELSGSTITITSLGELGGLATTPVINAPEVAIIGVNRLAVRPMWNGSGFVPRKMMNLSSSFDHRVIDGHEAAQFIRHIKELLEEPATLFLEA
jgi:2-oxoisovalerate dehydrogenase E2 component (dihydrolipoyl transacylase)